MFFMPYAMDGNELKRCTVEEIRYSLAPGNPDYGAMCLSACYRVHGVVHTTTRCSPHHYGTTRCSPHHYTLITQVYSQNELKALTRDEVIELKYSRMERERSAEQSR